MNVFVWKGRGESEWRLSVDKPTVCAEDDLWLDRKVGDIIGPLMTVCSIMPSDMAPFLPVAGEIREMKFHEDLWGKAKVLLSYDKQHWTELQRMLE